MFIKSSLRGQKVHKSMNFVYDLATLIGNETVGHLNHRDYKRIEWASVEKSRDKLNKSNGGSGI